jgi:acyl transferase domain-containing protein
VISGEVAGVERAMELAKAAGREARVRLNVSGAFHSPLMAPALPGLEAGARRGRLADPAFPCTRTSPRAGDAAADARALLARQLTAPGALDVEVVRAIAAPTPDALYAELGPGRVLAGLVKKIVPGARRCPCGTAADVERARPQPGLTRLDRMQIDLAGARRSSPGARAASAAPSPRRSPGAARTVAVVGRDLARAEAAAAEIGRGARGFAADVATWPRRRGSWPTSRRRSARATSS